MARNKGIVYLVGAGPGDAELITLKAIRLLRQADVVVFDRLVNPRIMQECPSEAERIYVGKASSKHTLPQDKINRLLVRLARQGKTVVRLKGGDPFVFGRGGEEILLLVKHRIPFEVVPGVTSAVAVPAYAGIPVTHRGLTVSFGIFTGQEDPTKEDTDIDWAKISTGLGTLVFLMGVENLGSIARTLIRYGRDPRTPACVVQWGTLPRQKSVQATLEDIEQKVRSAGLTPPAILIVGKVVSLRDRLNWFEKRPLFGRNILITVPSADTSRLQMILEQQGAGCMALPMIEIKPLADYARLDNAIKNIEGFHWLIFTSQNGVRFFAERLKALDADVRILAGIRIAAIGPKTKEAIEAMGLRVDVQPKDFTQEGLVAALRRAKIAGKNILIVRAQEARDVLPSGLEKLRARVCVLPAYRTEPRKEKVGIKDFLSEFDLVTFTSSSCVEGFFKAFSKQAVFSAQNRFKAASIGPITSRTCRQYGLKVAVEAKRYTLEGLAEAIVRYYSKKKKAQA